MIEHYTILSVFLLILSPQWLCGKYNYGLYSIAEEMKAQI